MATTDDLADDTGLFCLFKGPPKEGKSIAAHSFPNTYTFDFDNKIRAVKNYSAANSNYGATSFVYDTFDDLVMVRQKVEQLKKECPFSTLIVDGITEAANLAMSCMIRYRDPQWATAGKTVKTNSDKTIRAGVPMTEIADFNGESRFLSDLVDDLRVINIKHKTNIIVIAHVIYNEVTDMQGKVISSSKKLITAGNKIGASLPGKFEEVFHFERQSSMDPGSKPRFMCYTQDMNGNGAGTTLPLPGVIDWTDENFYNLIIKKIRRDVF